MGAAIQLHDYRRPRASSLCLTRFLLFPFTPAAVKIDGDGVVVGGLDQFGPYELRRAARGSPSFPLLLSICVTLFWAAATATCIAFVVLTGALTSTGPSRWLSPRTPPFGHRRRPLYHLL